MSFYNMLNGVTSATFFILPMLGHHPSAYPRFRDCFTADADHPEYDSHIHVYTRTGGGNREDFAAENDWMRDMDHFVTDFDDYDDSTYASWVFKVPEKWQADFDKIIKGTSFSELSEEYRAQIRQVWGDKIYSQMEQGAGGSNDD